MDHAEEVFDVVFPSGDETSEGVQPGEEPFDIPASLVAAKLAPVLGLAPAPAVGRNHLDAVLSCKMLIQSVRVVCFIADQAFWKFLDETSREDFFDELALGR